MKAKKKVQEAPAAPQAVPASQQLTEEDRRLLHRARTMTSGTPEHERWLEQRRKEIHDELEAMKPKTYDLFWSGLMHEEIPDEAKQPPDITEKEIARYLEARRYFFFARADFELKRAAIMKKLAQLADVEDGSYSLSIEGDDLVVSEHCDTCNQDAVRKFNW